jgi:hypothetical protein
VNGNKRMLTDDVQEFNSMVLESGFMLKDLGVEPVSRFPHYSRKTANRNVKILASRSMDILRALADIYFESPLEKRKIMKVSFIRSYVANTYKKHLL